MEKLAAAFVSDAQWIIKSILLNFFKEFFFVKSIGKKLIFLLFFILNNELKFNQLI